MHSCSYYWFRLDCFQYNIWLIRYIWKQHTYDNCTKTTILVIKKRGILLAAVDIIIIIIIIFFYRHHNHQHHRHHHHHHPSHQERREYNSGSGWLLIPPSCSSNTDTHSDKNAPWALKVYTVYNLPIITIAVESRILSPDRIKICIFRTATFGIFPPEANILRLLDQDDNDIDDDWSQMMTNDDDYNVRWWWWQMMMTKMTKAHLLLSDRVGSVGEVWLVGLGSLPPPPVRPTPD